MSTSHSALLEPFGHIINGKVWTQSEQTLSIVDPATERAIAAVPIATRETVDAAVSAARRAFISWGKTTWAHRAELVKAWRATYAADISNVAMLLSLEQGKSIANATSELNWSLAWFDELPTMELREEVVLNDDMRKVVKRYAPLGVTAGIVPWNYPVLLMIYKILPSILCGNCCIIKPSPFTPLSDIRIIKAAQAHLPPGVLQCIVGDEQLGPWITEHAGIDKIAFTGSTATGRAVARSCAATLKRVTLELGGNDASIVLPDVDISSVAEMVAGAALLNSGQFCAGSKRIFVHESVYEAFKGALVSVINGMKVGPGLQADTVQGPVNNKMQYEKVKDFFKDSQQNNHTFLTGGQLDDDTKTRGFFVPITLVDNPPESSRIVQEEPFGPIVPLLKWRTEKELLQRVNASEYGLSAVVFGKDDEAVDRIARGIEAGTVWINSVQMFSPRVPFGGWKKSGYGHENGYECLAGYSNLQILSFAK